MDPILPRNGASGKAGAIHYDYRAPEYDAGLVPLTPAAGAWAKSAKFHHCSGKVMFTLRPIPGKGSKSLPRFTKRVEKAFIGLRYAGYVTTGKPDGARLVEAHVALHRDDLAKLNMVDFKKSLRKSFNLVVTGKYAENEEVPTTFSMKNSRPHKYVLTYIANHSLHREANVLWTLPPVGRKRRRRKAGGPQVVVGAKKLFAEGAAQEHEIGFDELSLEVQ